MDFSKISYEDVLTKSSQLATSATNMKEILDEIVVQFNKIGDEGSWSGTAASDARKEFDSLAAQFEQFYKAITSCSKYLNNMVENYKSVDKAVLGGK